METNVITIITVIGGVAAIIYLIDFLSGQKLKKIYRISLFMLFGFAGVVLTLRLINNVTTKIKPEEPVIAKPVPIKRQPKTKINTPVSIDSDKTGNTQNSKPTEVINNSEKADFAVIVTMNGRKDNHLTSAFVGWLKTNGTVSQSILQSLFIDHGYFNQILDGNSSVIKNTSASQSVKNLCLVRSTITIHSK